MSDISSLKGIGLAIRISREVASVRIEDLCSVRIQHALESMQIETFGQLVRLSDEELLATRALGRKSLAEIHGAIAKVLSFAGVFDVLPEETKSTESESINQSESVSPGGWKVPPYKEEMLDCPVDLLDLSVRPTNVLNSLNVSTVRQLLNYSKRDLARTENIGRKSISEIEAKLAAHLSQQSKIDNDAGRDIRDGTAFHSAGIKDFIDQMLLLLPELQRTVLADRFGLWDGIAETLQDIGDKLGLTRERIRQIEANGLKRIRRRYKHGAIRSYIFEAVRADLDNEPQKCGVISEDEAMRALAIGCNIEEVALGVEFLQDIDSSEHNIFARNLIEAESQVYCAENISASRYREMLHLVQLSLRAHEKPLTEAILLREVTSQVDDAFNSDQVRLVRRIFSVSPKVSRLRNGTVALSEWMGHPTARKE